MDETAGVLKLPMKRMWMKLDEEVLWSVVVVDGCGGGGKEEAARKKKWAADANGGR